MSGDMQELGEAKGWIQLNVGLTRPGGTAVPSARALFARLEPLVGRWRDTSVLRWFFFMRKPPDVRLRFSIVAGFEAAGELAAQMESLAAEAVIEESFFSDYEPETERFGGGRAMDLVHQHFDADTSVWWALDRLEAQGRRAIPPEKLLPATIHDLFLRAGPDVESVARIWRRLQILIPAPPDTIPSEVRPSTLAGLLQSPLSERDEERALRKHAEAHAALADGLSALARNRQLRREVGDILAAVAMFTLHRHGFSGDRSGPLIAATLKGLRAGGTHAL